MSDKRVDTVVVSITFSSHRYDHGEVPPALKSVVVGRVVLPPAGARKLAAALYDFLAKNGAAKGVVTTPSGLEYFIVSSGPASGAHPKAQDR